MVKNDLSELNILPPVMKAKAKWAREQILNHPEKAEIDEDELLAWVFNNENKCWYSIAGNYSFSSPKEKMERRRTKAQKQREYEDRIDLKYIELKKQLEFENEIRQKVLDRDNHTCQNCEDKLGKFDIHHILKRKEHGTWHLDNLITVCKKCHKKVEQNGMA